MLVDCDNYFSSLSLLFQDKNQIPPIFLTKWWFGCFLDRVPFPLALRLWDVYLFEGDCILIAMAYNIMKMHQSLYFGSLFRDYCLRYVALETLRKLQMEQFMEFIQMELAKDFGFSDEATMASLNECLRKLFSDKMAVPPPPDPNGLSEVPTKALGPILSKSLGDIRFDIAELQSRASRANCTREPVYDFHFKLNIFRPIYSPKVSNWI